jgi:hypothetical protein
VLARTVLISSAVSPGDATVESWSCSMAGVCLLQRAALCWRVLSAKSSSQQGLRFCLTNGACSAGK